MEGILPVISLQSSLSVCDPESLLFLCMRLVVVMVGGKEDLLILRWSVLNSFVTFSRINAGRDFSVFFLWSRENFFTSPGSTTTFINFTLFLYQTPKHLSHTTALNFLGIRDERSVSRGDWGGSWAAQKRW